MQHTHNETVAGVATRQIFQSFKSSTSYCCTVPSCQFLIPWIGTSPPEAWIRASSTGFQLPKPEQKGVWVTETLACSWSTSGLWSWHHGSHTSKIGKRNLHPKNTSSPVLQKPTHQNGRGQSHTYPHPTKQTHKTDGHASSLRFESTSNVVLLCCSHLTHLTYLTHLSHLTSTLHFCVGQLAMLDFAACSLRNELCRWCHPCKPCHCRLLGVPHSQPFDRCAQFKRMFRLKMLLPAQLMLRSPPEDGQVRKLWMYMIVYVSVFICIKTRELFGFISLPRTPIQTWKHGQGDPPKNPFNSKTFNILQLIDH